MNRLLNNLKRTNFEMPIFIGKTLNFIPFNYRPGIYKLYNSQSKRIIEYEQYSSDKKKEYIFSQFYKVFEHAYKKIPFYHELYKNHGIALRDIRSFDDIRNVPIVRKKDLLNVNISDRSYPLKNRLLVNTGGSSGAALKFYIDPIRYGNEWAHIHSFWKLLGYQPHDLKITFDGRSSVRNFIQYDFVRNSLRLDINAPTERVQMKLLKILSTYEVRYLHGYPSAISNFASQCKNNTELINVLQRTLKGVFLSSEYPSPHYRNNIESVFNVKTQSFYGHTEGCVMAFETSKYQFKTLNTYGYAEGMKNETGQVELIGTSYYNYASPFIRYSTEDLIDGNSEEILESFQIKDGRIGEYIIDKYGNRISLTGLLFGRHHKLFNMCSHIQIGSNLPGTAIVYYVSTEDFSNANEYFDARNVNIDFSFVKLEKPIINSSGKINFLINKFEQN